MTYWFLGFVERAGDGICNCCDDRFCGVHVIGGIAKHFNQNGDVKRDLFANANTTMLGNGSQGAQCEMKRAGPIKEGDDLCKEAFDN